MALAPGLYVVPPRKGEPLAAAAVDVPAFVGMAERGPIGKARTIQGWPGFRTEFGGLLPNAQLAWAVRAFFENGGRRCHVVRVAAPPATTTSDPRAAQPADRRSSLVLDTLGFASGAAVFVTQEVTTSSVGPQPADRAASILLDLDGFVAGSRVEIAQDGVARIWRTARSLDRGTGRVGWDDPLPAAFELALLRLTVRRHALSLLADVTADTLHWRRPLSGDFSLTKPIVFATGAASAMGVLHDEMGVPVLQITAASPGAFGNAIEVRLARTVSADVGTRRVPRLDALDALSVDALADLTVGATVTVQQEGAPPARRRVRGIDTVARRVLLDRALPGAFDLAAAASGAKRIAVRRETFALSVHDHGRLAETHSGIDLPATAGASLLVLEQRSVLVRGERLAVGAPYPLPDPAAGPGPLGRVGLTGGRDGIAALRASDLINGLAVFEAIDEPAAMAVPDAQPDRTPDVETLPRPPVAPDPCALNPLPVASETDAPRPILIEAAPPLSLVDLRDVQRALIQHCEQRGDRLAILDAPRDLAAADPFDPDAARDWRVGLDSRFAAFYWPWLRVLDPGNRRASLRDLPPCGHVLGAFARSDLASGAHKAPANVPLDWVQALTREADDGRRALLNEAGVNVIRVLMNRGIRIYGARTLAPEPDHRLLNVRRILIQLRRSLQCGFAWVPFEPDNFALRAVLRAGLESFLEEFWRRGALAGATRDEGFSVAFEPPGAEGDGTLVIRIAVAPVSPAEFVFLTLTRSDEALDIREATTTTEAGP